MINKNNSLYNRIYKHLEWAITKGSFNPGEKLNEERLSRQFGVSRPPIREAFRLLQKEGLITTIPRRGAYVTRVTRKDAEDIYAIRVYLELLAVRLSFHRFKKNDFSFLEKILEKMEKATREHDFHLFGELNNQFHGKFFKKANNHRLEQLYEMFRKQIDMFRSFAFHVPSRLDKSSNEHQMIFSALKSQNLLLTESLFREHIENARKDLIDHLNSLKEEGK